MLKNPLPLTHRWSIVICLVCSTWLPAAAWSERADFTLPDINGETRSLSDYRGQWVLVNYWATWCPPCREELPELEVFHSGSEGQAVVLGVNMEKISKDRLSSFVEQQFLSYPILMASERPSKEQLLGPVGGLPTSYLVTPEGKIVARQVGPITAKAIGEFIARFETDNRGEK